MAFRGGLELSKYGLLGVIVTPLGLIVVTRQYGVALQHAKYSIKPAGTKIRKSTAAILSHPNRGTMRQNVGDLPQPGGRSTEGPSDFYGSCTIIAFVRNYIRCLSVRIFMHCIEYLKGYALCRRPLLASRGCHQGGSVPLLF